MNGLDSIVAGQVVRLASNMINRVGPYNRGFELD